MITRKNVNSLATAEKAELVAAIKAIKANGKYDQHVLRHAQAPMTNIHRCPAFLPWHRQFILDFENDLQEASGNPQLALPYWNWADDAALPDPATAPVWAADLLGGNGDAADGGIVKTGPFRQGQWTIVSSSGSPAGPLIRRFGVAAPTLASTMDVADALSTTPFDASPWNLTSQPSFRNRLEGWYGASGPGLHNRAHVWVGGSMLPMTSPNDPVFFLHHCYVDKIWADWQIRYPNQDYLPTSGASTGQNIDDLMESTVSGRVTPRDVGDHHALGYSYDTESLPQLVVNNFGYSAGGWRVNRHPRMLADLTGDGTADIAGFGTAGVYVSRNKGNGTFLGIQRVIDNFGYGAGGWRVDRHPRFLADLTGSGRSDVVGFGNAGVYLSRNNGDATFQPLKRVIDNFGYGAGGWRVERHPRFLADLTGNGRSDVVGFGNAGVYVALNKGDGTFHPLQRVIDNFGYSAGGWRVERHPRFLADLTGDGKAGVVGCGNAGIYVARNKGDGTFHPLQRVIDNFGYGAGGWRVNMHPRMLADLTGDGTADFVGFGNAGVYVALNNGDGTFQPVQRVVNNFGYAAGGWRTEKHPRFFVDVTGDGTADIVGFGNAGVYISYNNGDGTFQPPQRVVNNFGFISGGWRVDRHPRLLADLTGDNRADIVGFGDAGAYVWRA